MDPKKVVKEGTPMDGWISDDWTRYETEETPGLRKVKVQSVVHADGSKAIYVMDEKNQRITHQVLRETGYDDAQRKWWEEETKKPTTNAGHGIVKSVGRDPQRPNIEVTIYEDGTKSEKDMSREDTKEAEAKARQKTLDDEARERNRKTDEEQAATAKRLQKEADDREAARVQARSDALAKERRTTEKSKTRGTQGGKAGWVITYQDGSTAFIEDAPAKPTTAIDEGTNTAITTRVDEAGNATTTRTPITGVNPNANLPGLPQVSHVNVVNAGQALDEYAQKLNDLVKAGTITTKQADEAMARYSKLVEIHLKGQGVAVDSQTNETNRLQREAESLRQQSAGRLTASQNAMNTAMRTFEMGKDSGVDPALAGSVMPALLGLQYQNSYGYGGLQNVPTVQPGPIATQLSGQRLPGMDPAGAAVAQPGQPGGPLFGPGSVARAVGASPGLMPATAATPQPTTSAPPVPIAPAIAAANAPKPVVAPQGLPPGAQPITRGALPTTGEDTPYTPPVAISPADDQHLTALANDPTFDAEERQFIAEARQLMLSGNARGAARKVEEAVQRRQARNGTPQQWSPPAPSAGQNGISMMPPQQPMAYAQPTATPGWQAQAQGRQLLSELGFDPSTWDEMHAA